MFKEQLLSEILRFSETKHRRYFTKEELLVYIWFRHRNKPIKFETILRQLRLLARQGFITPSYRENKEWGSKYTVYFINKHKIKHYLETRGGGNA